MTTEHVPEQADVVVVGGGLAGLTAAVLLARGGQQVALVEKAARPGGRAISRTERGMTFNLGPHALYRAGAAYGLMTELGIRPAGGAPPTDITLEWADRLHALPGTALGFLTTTVLPPAGRLQLIRVLARLPWMQTGRLRGVALGDWARRSIPNGRVRTVFYTLMRLCTYSADVALLDAAAALEQFRLAMRGTLYLDGGWQQLVDALRQRAAAEGVRMIRSRVQQVVVDGGVQGVRLAPDRRIRAGSVILAVPPAAAIALLQPAPPPSLIRWAGRLEPVRAACLDLGLARLPNPGCNFALGADRPLYFSNHAATARLGTGGEAVVHLLRYIGSGEEPAQAALEAELEGFMDRLQPGWRAGLLVRRFLPYLTVTHALPTIAGRPDVPVAEIPGLYLAGDWVGPTGMLADAACASAQQGAHHILTGDNWAPRVAAVR